MRKRAAAALEPAMGGRGWLIVARLAGWTATLIALGFGLYRLEKYTSGVQSRKACTIEWRNLPPWLEHPNQADFLAQREAEAGLTRGDHPGDGSLAERVGVNLSGSPWIAEVQRVQVRSDGRIIVEARWREPLAVVERDGKALLIDVHGCVLRDDQPLNQVDRRDWHVIRGIEARATAPGGVLAGDDLRAGIELVQYLMRAEAAGALNWRGLIRAIDVSNHKLRRDRRAGEARILTTNVDAPIDWGLPPGREHGIEPAAQDKLTWLNLRHAEGALLSARAALDPRDPRRRP